MSSPLFSVITVVRNAESLIAGTVASVLEQAHPSVEYIIVDGASSDGTLAALAPYRPRISRVVSERDNGIYDAMNKGAALSAGQFLYFLNAGDRFSSPDTLGRVARVLEAAPDGGVIYGNVCLASVPEGTVMNPRTYRGAIRDLRDLFTNMFCQQRAFVQRDVFRRLGGLDTSYRIIADYDLVFRAFRKHVPFVYMDEDIVSIPLGGFSNTHLDLFLKERWRSLGGLPWNQRYWILDWLAGALLRGSMEKYIGRTFLCRTART